MSGIAEALQGTNIRSAGLVRQTPGASVMLGSEKELAMKKVLMVLALSSGLVLSACNTVRGAANDVESVGDCVDGKKGNC